MDIRIVIKNIKISEMDILAEYSNAVYFEVTINFHWDYNRLTDVLVEP